MYKVIDTHTKQVISTHKTLRAAYQKYDRLDNAYGGYRYIHQYVAA